MKTRVLIVGGGPSGLATAWELAHGPCKEDLDVSVYTLGWRLGGKGDVYGQSGVRTKAGLVSVRGWPYE